MAEAKPQLDPYYGLLNISTFNIFSPSNVIREKDKILDQQVEGQNTPVVEGQNTPTKTLDQYETERAEKIFDQKIKGKITPPTFVPGTEFVPETDFICLQENFPQFDAILKEKVGIGKDYSTFEIFEYRRDKEEVLDNIIIYNSSKWSPQFDLEILKRIYSDKYQESKLLIEGLGKELGGNRDFFEVLSDNISSRLGKQYLPVVFNNIKTRENLLLISVHLTGTCTVSPAAKTTIILEMNYLTKDFFDLPTIIVGDYNQELEGINKIIKDNMEIESFKNPAIQKYLTLGTGILHFDSKSIDKLEILETLNGIRANKWDEGAKLALERIKKLEKKKYKDLLNINYLEFKSERVYSININFQLIPYTGKKTSYHRWIFTHSSVEEKPGNEKKANDFLLLRNAATSTQTINSDLEEVPEETPYKFKHYDSKEDIRYFIQNFEKGLSDHIMLNYNLTIEKPSYATITVKCQKVTGSSQTVFYQECYVQPEYQWVPQGYQPGYYQGYQPGYYQGYPPGQPYGGKKKKSHRKRRSQKNKSQKRKKINKNNSLSKKTGAKLKTKSTTKKNNNKKLKKLKKKTKKRKNN